ncbi:MAG: molybdate ABC transporter substrate-binding protein [Oscillospiraceae bacterium]
MKKLLSLALALALTLALAACGAPAPAPAPDAVELTVFAAASLTETMDKIIAAYKTVAPNVTITATYDSSGTLRDQIAAGADCDLFLSAAGKQMDALEAGKKPDSLDLIDGATRIKLLENKVVLVAPEGNPAGVVDFADMEHCDLIAIGNSDVPVGGYSLEIFKALGLDIGALEASGQITYGSNVKEVLTQVQEGTVDCGIVYATDAVSAGLPALDTATPELCGQVLYPAAVLKSSKNPDAAKAFLTYLQGEDAMTIFKSVGFIPAQ